MLFCRLALDNNVVLIKTNARAVISQTLSYIQLFLKV